MVSVIGLLNFEACSTFFLVLGPTSLNLVLLDQMQVPSRIPEIKHKAIDLPILQLKCCWVDWLLKEFLGTEIRNDLIGDIPGVHEKLPSLILP